MLHRTYQSKHAFSEEDLRSLPFKQRPDVGKVPSLRKTPLAGVTRRYAMMKAMSLH